MICQVRQPHPRLTRLLHGPLVGWTESSPAPSPHRELPFPGLPLILSFGEPFRLRDPRRPANEALRIGSFVAGLDDWYTESLSPAGSCAVQVNFTPVGARLILGVPLEILTRRIIPLADLLGAEGVRLELQLGAASTWAARFDRLDAWLVARLDRAAAVSHDVTWIWNELERSAGTSSVGALGNTLGWSRQRMVTRCRHELGMPPKLLARIVRFSTMTARLRTGQARSWSALAAECGYHDQSHLIREVRQFAACTPMELPGHLPTLPA